MLRLLRLSGGMLVGIGLFAVLSTFGARLPEQQICVTVSIGDDLCVYDVHRGLLASETRYALPSISWLPDDDYRVAAYPDLEDGRRYRLMLEPQEAGDAILLEEAAYTTESGWWFGRTLWSPDQRRLAYLWQDARQQEHLTIFSIADRSKPTAALTQFDPQDDDVFLIGWSADGAYLTLREQDMRGGSALHIWSVEMMQPVALDPDLPPLIVGAWSPEGQVFAAITQQQDQERLLLFISPENGENSIRVPVSTDIYSNIAWSPDGRRLVLARQPLINRDNLWLYQWYFDRFNSDGTLIQQDIVGNYIPQPAPGDPGNPINFIPGFWSLDGKKWIFLQDRGEDADFADLKALDTTSGDIEVMEANLVADLALQMFYPTFNTFSSFQQSAATPDNRLLMLPLWRDNALTLEYINFETGQRLTLLEGASDIPDTAFEYSFPPLARQNETNFVVPWVDSSAETHLRVVHADDGEVIIDIGEMESLSRIRLLTNNWIGYMSERDSEHSIEMVNVQTGEHQRILTGLGEQNTWFGVLSPDQRRVAIFVSDSQSLLASGAGQLFIITLGNSDVHVIEDNVLPYPAWSPDSSMLTFSYRGENRRTGIHIVNTAGETVQRTLLPPALYTQSPYRWSHCEENPPLNL
jgi:Tol biopolymer transport system component